MSRSNHENNHLLSVQGCKDAVPQWFKCHIRCEALSVSRVLQHDAYTSVWYVGERSSRDNEQLFVLSTPHWGEIHIDDGDTSVVVANEPVPCLWCDSGELLSVAAPRPLDHRNRRWGLLFPKVWTRLLIKKPLCSYGILSAAHKPKYESFCHCDSLVLVLPFRSSSCCGTSGLQICGTFIIAEIRAFLSFELSTLATKMPSQRSCS